MKLLYITNQVCGSGGLERVLSTKASYLVDFLDYEVHILTLNQSSKPLFFEFSKKITFHDISLPNNIFGYAKNYISGVKKVVKNYKPDVVLVCDDGLKGFLLPQILKNKCPIIYERHVSKSIFLNEKDRFLQKQKNKLTFFAMNFLGKFFSKFVVLTQGNLAEWNFNNLEVIPNPLSFYPDESTSLTQKIVIAVGKQSYQKGYDRLLKIWQIVNKSNPDCILRIFGTFDENLQLNSLAKELNIESSVQFFEAEKDIQKHFLEASIFVLSSRFEGFGMVIIEAMACGLPVISFDCPHGPKDIISENIDGFLIENNNVQQFANKINLLIEDQNLRMKLGNNAKINVKKYLIENVIQKWDNLFKSLNR